MNDMIPRIAIRDCEDTEFLAKLLELSVDDLSKQIDKGLDTALDGDTLNLSVIRKAMRDLTLYDKMIELHAAIVDGHTFMHATGDISGN